MSPSLSVIIPTRNERDNAARVVGAVRAALDGVDYEVVFVDDSMDGTDDLLRGAAGDDPRIVVHHRGRGDGLAGAVLEGFRRSRGQAVAVLDGDLQHPPGLLPVMLRRLDEASADIVVASRFAPGGGAPGLGPMRLVISRAAGALARVLLRGARRTTDPLSGYFVVRRSAIHGVPLRPIGFKILLEILVRGRGERVADVPFVFDARAGGRSKASPRAAAALLRQITLLAASNPHDARVWKFGLVGASGLAIDVALFWLQVDRLGIPVVGAGLVAGAVSTVSNFVLNSLFTWADRPASGPPMYLSRMLRYYVTTWAGQVVYLSVLWALTQVGIAPMLANLIGVLTGGALNYVVHNLWTWRHTHAG